jgi:hypothetical protein
MGRNPIGLNYGARLCSGKGNLKRKAERKSKTKTIQHGYPQIIAQPSNSKATQPRKEAKKALSLSVRLFPSLEAAHRK